MTENREALKASLLNEIDQANIPAHIGIIMDGNGRWAKSHGKTRIHGHQEGARRVKTIVRFANDLGVKHISLYAFSVENWARPSFEVSALMRLIRAYIIRERNDLHAEGVRFRLLGRMAELAPEIIRQAQISTELMQNNPGLTLNLCINYGGRAEIVDAVKSIISSGFKPEQISEDLISQHLYWPELPDVDLMIRTSGEMRTSNFHLWRGAYAELYFTPVLWPDFDDVELLRSIHAYQNRERRFGKISEQLKKE
ncbi:MAG TPA: polyprenyl diphosphate synthase [Candidatus Rifleibacterium sp.]|nr:polyprenyl diphosphate synthase [Candidatus Rifleibacterium sp.]